MLTRQQLQEMYDSGPAVMLHYVECLLSHLADVERIIGHQQQCRIDELAAILARSRKQLERAKHRLARKECEVYALQRRIAELQAEVERSRQVQNELTSMAVKRDSHNSGLPPSSDPPRAKAANAVRRTRSLRGKSDKKVGAQAGHRGATLHQVEFPDRLKVHAPPKCRACWMSLAQGEVVGQHRRQVFDLPMVAMEVTEHWAQTKRCDRCGKRTKARFPEGVNAPVQYGERVRSVATYLHKYQLLPFARTSEAMRDLFGCRISPGTIETTRHRASEKLVGVEEQIKQGIKTAEVIGADETGLRVAGKSAWVHVARTDLLTHYAYDTRRGKMAMDAIGILPQFTGICIRDGWFSYDEYRQATHALCNVHLLRELVYIEECCAEQQQWTRPLAKLLLGIKAAVEEAKGKGETKLSDEQQATFTMRYDRLVKRAARLNPEPQQESPGSCSPRSKVVSVKSRAPALPLIRRLQSKGAEFLRFMTDFRVAFDNNAAERDIRMVKLQQKIGGCFRTEEGAEAFCRIRSYLSTARKQGHSPLTALEQAFAGKPLVLLSSWT